MVEKILNLNIAELIVTSEPVVISTVLGSCVSVCLFSRSARAGGMIHYALPKAEGVHEEPLRYGNFAIPQLVRELEAMTGTSDFVAKIVGGANNIGSEKAYYNIGDENVNTAREILRQLGVEIVAEDVGGNDGRKVLFHTMTGRLQSAPVGPGHDRRSTVAKTETGFTKKPPPKQYPTIGDKKKVKVLIVDDSKTIRELLKKILTQDSDIEVVGQAEDPIQAEALLVKLKPDVITLDVHMPKMTGVQWLEKLLPKRPIPVVMITSLQLQDGNEVFRALELGAVDYIQKPALNEIREISPIIQEKVKCASLAKVRTIRPMPPVKSTTAKAIPFKPGTVWAIGASTGGTEALRVVLMGLPPNIPPIVIVQHIPPIFSRAFSERLNSLCEFEVKEAEDGDAVHENRVLIAPGATQMKLVRKPSGLFVEVNSDPPVNRHRPSVDYLFNSVAELIGQKAIGVILTGMGEDGAKGLLNMKNNGAHTIGQDEESCVVYGMPKAAFELGAVEVVSSLIEIPQKIMGLRTQKKTA